MQSLPLAPKALTTHASNKLLDTVQTMAIQKNAFTKMGLKVVVVAMMPTPRNKKRMTYDAPSAQPHMSFPLGVGHQDS